MCSNGDVKLASDGTPWIYWDDLWSPICGTYFWDNNHGAEKFCQKLGYTSGTISHGGSGWLGRASGSYGIDSFRIGRCNDNDAWPSCSGGCNDYKVGGTCSYWNTAHCTAEQVVKIIISCTGGLPRSSSCPGN